MVTTIEAAQQQIDSLIRTADRDLQARGVLMLNRAQALLSAVKHASREMELCEQVTPADFFNPKWRQQRRMLGQLQIRLSRIIDGTAVMPPCNHRI